MLRFHAGRNAAAATLTLLLLPLTAGAETPGYHPRYLHGRSDLRVAHNMLLVDDEPNVMRELRIVQNDISHAIIEIDNASVIDRKDIDDHPRIDTDLDRPGRFRKAWALLNSARADIAQEEDNDQAVGWRNAALRHIDNAKAHLRRAAQNLRLDRDLGF
jgi:hypothetical protein